LTVIYTSRIPASSFFQYGVTTIADIHQHAELAQRGVKVDDRPVRVGRRPDRSGTHQNGSYVDEACAPYGPAAAGVDPSSGSHHGEQLRAVIEEANTLGLRCSIHPKDRTAPKWASNMVSYRRGGALLAQTGQGFHRERARAAVDPKLFPR
jgi:hypothetical protein